VGEVFFGGGKGFLLLALGLETGLVWGKHGGGGRSYFVGGATGKGTEGTLCCARGGVDVGLEGGGLVFVVGRHVCGCWIPCMCEKVGEKTCKLCNDLICAER
jgi:hypothetical protein